MMPLRFLRPLLLACSFSVCYASEPPKSCFELADYTSFGSTTRFPFSALEAQEIDRLCRACVSLDSRASMLLDYNTLLSGCNYTPAEVNGHLRGLNTNDKACLVVMSLLGDDNPLMQLDNLLRTRGYSSYLLLRKLLHFNFVTFLTETDTVQQQDAVQRPNAVLVPICCMFIALRCKSVKSIAILPAINAKLHELADAALSSSLTACAQKDKAEDDRHLDYLFLLRKKQRLEEEELITELRELIDYWLGDGVRFTRYKTTILNFFRATQQSNAIESVYRGLINSRVFFTASYIRAPACIELLEALGNEEFVTSNIRTTIGTKDYRTVNPQLVLFCIQALKKKRTRIQISLDSLTEKLVPKPAEFNALPSDWSTIPSYFNALAPTTLRRIFLDAYEHMPASSHRDETMYRYMSLLNFENYMQIICYATLEMRDHLKHFMLYFLRDPAKRIYFISATKQQFDEKKSNRYKAVCRATMNSIKTYERYVHETGALGTVEAFFESIGLVKVLKTVAPETEAEEGQEQSRKRKHDESA
ncbi:hypothetical protein PAPHI01_1910 [Pancytospora philotis]|nr:hypothetical protein PAPHI01_1910 [Pancytospora philotis]